MQDEGAAGRFAIFADKPGRGGPTALRPARLCGIAHLSPERPLRASDFSLAVAEAIGDCCVGPRQADRLSYDCPG